MDKNSASSVSIELYEKLTKEEREIVNALVIKKYVSKKLTTHDVAAAFVAKRKVEPSETSPELQNILEKMEKYLEV
jgi:hypothetical protein